MIDPNQPTGLHFSPAVIAEAVAAMRARLDEKAAAGDISPSSRRAAEIFVLGYAGFAPAEISRGVSMQEMGAAVIGSLGWIVAQLCIGAPTVEERLSCIADIASVIAERAMGHLSTGQVVAAMRGKRGAHA